MRYTIIATIALVYSAAALRAQTVQKLSIDRATVFLKGAQLQSTARLHLDKGETEVTFTNVAGDVNSQSITVNATNGPSVASATFQNNYLVTDNITPKEKALKDSIEDLTEARGAIANRIAMLAEQLAVLQGNRKVGGDNTGLSVAELTKMLDLINTRMEGYLNQKSKQEKLLAKADERLVSMNKQLDEEYKKDVQTGGRLIVKFYAATAVTSDVTISYVVPNAGWTTNYDIRVDDISKPASLYYKANVYQMSGVKWDNVRLTLSTGNPQEGIDAPALNPWYLAFYVPPPPPVPQQNAPVVRQYKKNLINENEGRHTMTSEEIRVLPQSSIDQYVIADNTGINTSFDIDLPYTILNNGQMHMVAIKKYDLPATYRYYAAPKLDKDAFLQALLTNWEDLNLIPGQSNIFYEGTYVGQGFLDMRNVKDTMAISLGRDKKILVKREQDKKLRSVKTIGSNVRETFAYTITVRNTRKEPIYLLLQDQQPVSNDKDIVIEDKNTGNAEYDETTGMMKWPLTLNANESREIKFGYTIKYPKGKQVSGLR